MSRHHRPRSKLFAIARFDAGMAEPEHQSTGVQVPRTKNEARAEVNRLVALNTAKGNRLFWQPTRLIGTDGRRACAAAV